MEDAKKRNRKKIGRVFLFGIKHFFEGRKENINYYGITTVLYSYPYF